MGFLFCGRPARGRQEALECAKQGLGGRGTCARGGQPEPPRRISVEFQYKRGGRGGGLFTSLENNCTNVFGDNSLGTSYGVLYFGVGQREGLKRFWVCEDRPKGEG